MKRDIPASVRGRLEDLARQSGRPLQELMQYFVMERFLFRLSQSEYADRFVLKGALMFTVWGTPQARATRDIDLLARAENSVDAMSSMIKDVCGQPVESDGVEFLSDSVRGEIIKENADYSGVRVTFVAMIQNARLPIECVVLKCCVTDTKETLNLSNVFHNFSEVEQRSAESIDLVDHHTINLAGLDVFHQSF